MLWHTLNTLTPIKNKLHTFFRLNRRLFSSCWKGALLEIIQIYMCTSVNPLVWGSTPHPNLHFTNPRILCWPPWDTECDHRLPQGWGLGATAARYNRDVPQGWVLSITIKGKTMPGYVVLQEKKDRRSVIFIKTTKEAIQDAT